MGYADAYRMYMEWICDMCVWNMYMEWDMYSGKSNVETNMPNHEDGDDLGIIIRVEPANWMCICIYIIFMRC